MSSATEPVTLAGWRSCALPTWLTTHWHRAGQPGWPAGLAGTRGFLEVRHRRGQPARWIESHVVAEGDLVVQFGRRQDMSAGGTFRGFDVPTGVYTRDAVFACRLVDGRIAERWAIRDDLAMMVQLGALKPKQGKG
jgi:hypothetical protein